MWRSLGENGINFPDVHYIIILHSPSILLHACIYIIRSMMQTIVKVHAEGKKQIHVYDSPIYLYAHLTQTRCDIQGFAKKNLI